MDVLLLNASEEVLDVIDWVKAVKLLFAQKAEKPHNHTDHYKIRTTNGYFELPSVIILREYVRVPFFRSKSPSKRNVYRRDGNRCQYCGCHLNSKNSSIDHVMPRSRGGGHTWNNIVSACKPCNRKKSNRTPEEARMPLQKQPVAPTRNAIMFASLEGKEQWERWARLLIT
jgi:5-methylcytosine-specific restriction endonuclease McrA